MKTSICLMVVLFPLCLAAVVHSATWRVEHDGSGDFTTIQPAFDAAAAGDTILIGPGEYREYGMHQPPGWGIPIAIGGYKNFNDIGSGEPLTILGESAETTIIGPDENPQGFDTGFLITGEDVPLVIKNITMHTWFQGITTGYRQILLEFFRGLCPVSLSLDYVPSIRITNCYFENGTVGIGHSQNVEVIDCQSVDAQFSFNGVQNVLVRDCVFSDFDGLTGGIQFQSASTGVVENCQIVEAHNGITLYSGSSVGLFNNYIDGTNVSLALGGPEAHIYGTNNIVAGAEFSSIYVLDNSTFDFHGNHILNDGTPGSYSVRCNFLVPPAQDLDLTGNFWGTDNADQIAEWVYDSEDDPGTNVRVEYIPFEGQPVPTESKTWSELKSMYR